MATGSVVVEFVSYHVTAQPRKSQESWWLYRSWAVANFVSNLVAMATRVGRCEIWPTSFDSFTRKTPCYLQKSRRYLL